MEFQLSYFKPCGALNMSANLENSAVAIGLEKVRFHFNPKERQWKECSHYCTVALISHTSKVMLKILQARLQQYVKHELPDVQAGFRKGRGTRDQIATSAGSLKKQESFRKTSISALLTMPKPLTVWITINCGKFWRTWEYQTTWPASWETCMQNTKQQLELEMEQQTDWFQIGKGVCQGCIYCHPAYLTYMQSTSWETLGGGSTSWNQDCREKYQ